MAKKQIAPVTEEVLAEPALRSINIVWSCNSGRPAVSFNGDWSRKDVRTTLNAILRAFHQRLAKLRKAAIQSTEQENTNA